MTRIRSEKEKEQNRIRARNNYQADPEAARIKSKQYRLDNPEKYHAWAKRSKEKLKNEVFEIYGNKCSCCGETERLFLTIDHVNGGGNAHRRKVGGTNEAVYRDIRKKRSPGFS